MATTYFLSKTDNQSRTPVPAVTTGAAEDKCKPCEKSVLVVATAEDRVADSEDEGRETDDGE